MDIIKEQKPILIDKQPHFIQFHYHFKELKKEKNIFISINLKNYCNK
jgi:hypothetical protein